MKRSNLEKYYLSMKPLSEILDTGILSKDNYLIAEKFLAEKYCINKGNLYRLNDLTIPHNKVINGVTEEEVNTNGKDSNQDKFVFEITKKN